MIAEVMKMREEENNKSSLKSKTKAIFKNRWAYPALYLGSAAIIITSILWYQAANTPNIAEEPQDFGYVENGAVGQKDLEPTAEVVSQEETVEMPVMNPDAVTIIKQFYNAQASAEEQEAALVVYNNIYYENTGIDIAMDGEEFDVVASMSGKVVSVEEDSFLGNYVVLDHGNGVETRYQAVKDVMVSVGEVVTQGDKLAISSTSELNSEAGNHLHFEVRKDGIAVDPIAFFNRPAQELKDADLSEEEPKKEEAEEGTEAGDGEESTDPEAEDHQANPTSEEGSDSDSDSDSENSEDQTEDQE